MTLPIYLPPNMEALVSAFLRDQPELADLPAMLDDAGDVKVYTAIPKAPSYPLVRVTQILDTPNGSPLWSVAFDIQVEAFGGSKGEAWLIASTARALIDARITGEHPGYGVVNGSTPGALLDLPDDDSTPAKPRWLFTSTIYARPGATVQS